MYLIFRRFVETLSSTSSVYSKLILDCFLGKSCLEDMPPLQGYQELGSLSKWTVKQWHLLANRGVHRGRIIEASRLRRNQYLENYKRISGFCSVY